VCYESIRSESDLYWTYAVKSCCNVWREISSSRREEKVEGHWLCTNKDEYQKFLEVLSIDDLVEETRREHRYSVECSIVIEKE